MPQDPSNVVVSSVKCQNVFTKSNIAVRASMVCFIYPPGPYTYPLVFNNLPIPMILIHHTCRITRTFSNRTYVCTSYGLLNLLLVNTGFFFFDIFLTFRLFFTLTSGSFSASSYSTVLYHVFRGLDMSISDSSSSCDILSCLLGS